MNETDYNARLYEKMKAEQDKYRDWLKGQPSEEILHHSYEYTVREDILMSMEELTLSEAETRALLLSPSSTSLASADRPRRSRNGPAAAVAAARQSASATVCRAVRNVSDRGW